MGPTHVGLPSSISTLWYSIVMSHNPKTRNRIVLIHEYHVLTILNNQSNTNPKRFVVLSQGITKAAPPLPSQS